MRNRPDPVRARPGDPSARLPLPIGREVVSVSDQSILDLTVELISRSNCSEIWGPAAEPADKYVVRLRADRRDAGGPPTVAYLESGGARQLAAALLRAADLVDELVEEPRTDS